MNFEQITSLGIISFILVLFIWDKFRYDIVALTGLFLCILFNLIPYTEAFHGFSHPATITVIFVLILSSGLSRSGAVESLAKIIAPVASVPSLHIAALIFIATFLSMFINNIGALALLMPMAIQSTVKAGRSPATVLMPLSFGSILGGMVTMIGTPPNIIISSYREKTLGSGFNMFDFAPVGGAVAAAGVLFMILIGWKLVKVRKTNAGIDLFEVEGYLFEVKISEKSKIISKTMLELEEILSKNNLNLVGLIHKKQKYINPPKNHTLIKNDLLQLEGAQDDIDKLVSQYKLSLLSADNAKEAILHSKDTTVVELVVGPNSRLEGRTVEEIRFKHSLRVNLLAVARQGISYRNRLKYFKFKAGDVILLHGEEDLLDDASNKLGCYPLAQRKLNFGKRKLALPALLIFLAAVSLSALQYLPLQVCLGLAVAAFVLLNIVPVKTLYEAIDWPVIVLLGAMIPIGEALENLGTTAFLSNYLVNSLGNVSLTLILALLLILTMTLSDVLNNAATAILMAPVAYNIALASHASPDPFLMAVAVGASCSFLTPIGHQNNAFILGPGGYRFGDYWRMGLPLEIIITAVAIPMIRIIWPFFP